MSKLKTTIIIAGSTIAAALITYWGTKYAADRNKSAPTVSQKSTFGSNSSISGDSDNAIIQNGSGPKAASIGQSGGITAGSLSVNLYPVLLPKNLGRPSSSKPPKSPTCWLDTAKKIIHIAPRAGQWDTPFVAFPASEKDVIQPHFSPDNKESIAVGQSTFSFYEDSIWALSTASLPATPEMGYQLHYEKRPSYVLFGNLNGPTYKLPLPE